jgi:HNH endonuclease
VSVSDLCDIDLTNGRATVVSAEDFDLVSRWSWFASKGSHTWYAVRKEGSREVAMHRVIMGVTDPEIHVDHIDGNGLNNQRSNLRIATRAQNQHNRGLSRNNKSGRKGVHRHTGGRWRAGIRVNRRQIDLGLFDDLEAAAAAYDAAALEYYGEFARTNARILGIQ